MTVEQFLIEFKDKIKNFSKHGFSVQLPYGAHMGVVEPFPDRISRTVLEHKNIYEYFQIMKSFLLGSDAYNINNDSHKHKKFTYEIAIIPNSFISTNPIWEQLKIGKADILEARYKKILDEIWLYLDLLDQNLKCHGGYPSQF